jgi:AraC-like DNA-binding protein
VHDLLRQTASGTWPDRHRRSPPRRRPATVRAHRELVEHARSLLTRDYAARLGLADVAAAVHLSPYHLARLFRDHTGVTMHSYRTRMRVLAGLQRLANPRTDLAALAAELGFVDQSHFSNSFRRVLGVPPSTVRGHDETSRILQA